MAIHVSICSLSQILVPSKEEQSNNRELLLEEFQNVVVISQDLHTVIN